LTFLFTDIEGHSALWEEHPGAMSEALLDQHMQERRGPGFSVSDRRTS
jgi:class 3 adenylate cyclase